MSLRQRLKINLLASWGDHSVALLIGLFLMPYVLHTLGDETYGLWLFICSIAGYSGLLNLGFGETISRYVAGHHARNETDRMNQVVSVIGVVYACMGTVALMIAGVLAWLAPSLHDWGASSAVEIQWVFLILGVNVAVGIVGSVFGGVLVGIQRFDIERGLTVSSGILRLVLTVALLRAEFGLLTLALIFLAVTCTENLGYVIFAYAKVKTLSVRPRHFRWTTLKECFSFSTFAFINGVAWKLIEATDTVIIGIVFGARAIVPYYVALRLCQFIARPIQHIGTVSMPRAGELHAQAQAEHLRVLLSKGLGLAFLLTMGMFIGAGYFGRALIETWVGAGYDESHALLLVLLGAQIVATPIDVVRCVLFGMGHVRKPALLYFIEAIANLVLTLILIHPFGLMGVAMGTAIPLVIVELGMLLPYALRKLQFEPRRLFHTVLAPQMLPLIALLGYSVAVSTLFPFQTGWFALAAISLGGGAVLGTVWLCTARWSGTLSKSPV